MKLSSAVVMAVLAYTTLAVPIGEPDLAGNYTNVKGSNSLANVSIQMLRALRVVLWAIWMFQFLLLVIRIFQASRVAL